MVMVGNLFSVTLISAPFTPFCLSVATTTNGSAPLFPELGRLLNVASYGGAVNVTLLPGICGE